MSGAILYCVRYTSGCYDTYPVHNTHLCNDEVEPLKSPIFTSPRITNQKVKNQRFITLRCTKHGRGPIDSTSARCTRIRHTPDTDGTTSAKALNVRVCSGMKAVGMKATKSLIKARVLN